MDIFASLTGAAGDKIIQHWVKKKKRENSHSLQTWWLSLKKVTKKKQSQASHFYTGGISIAAVFKHWINENKILNSVDFFVECRALQPNSFPCHIFQLKICLKTMAAAECQQITALIPLWYAFRPWTRRGCCVVDAENKSYSQRNNRVIRVQTAWALFTRVAFDHQLRAAR